mgnify:CR=1 FL=1
MYDLSWGDHLLLIIKYAKINCKLYHYVTFYRLRTVYYILKELPKLSDYNRILASYMDGILYLAIAQGKSLFLCNTYKAPDFTTAEYFIFLAMRKLQLNPEVSTICFRTPLDEEEEMSLYRYFKNVEQI